MRILHQRSESGDTECAFFSNRLLLDEKIGVFSAIHGYLFYFEGGNSKDSGYEDYANRIVDGYTPRSSCFLDGLCFTLGRHGRLQDCIGSIPKRATRNLCNGQD